MISAEDERQWAIIYISPALLPYFNMCTEMGIDVTFKQWPRDPDGLLQVLIITLFLFGRVGGDNYIYFVPIHTTEDLRS